MDKLPSVSIPECKLSENVFRDGDKVWDIPSLIEKAKGLKEFDLPLFAIYSGSRVWSPIESAYQLAYHMKRVRDVDTSKPIILDEEGFIMDGWHRVARALLDGKETIKAVRFDVTPAPNYCKDSNK